MKFKMPTASRKRLEKLLETLGSRAKDFKKCFDIESKWCWKYADLVLRGMKKRDLEYAEGHHVVPASFYGKRGCDTVDNSNLTVLTYGEHVLAHYCLIWCATGKMRGKMVKAFLIMYNVCMAGRKPLMPSEEELLDAIPEMEIKRIQAMEPKWAKLEAEGRTHKSEDPIQYKKDYREANIEYIRAYDRERNSGSRRGYLKEYLVSYWESHKSKLQNYKKDWDKKNAEHLKQYNRDRYAEQHDKLRAQQNANYYAKREAGYRRRKNPLTGKSEWVFVGLPATPETPKSTSGAA